MHTYFTYFCFCFISVNQALSSKFSSFFATSCLTVFLLLQNLISLTSPSILFETNLLLHFLVSQTSTSSNWNGMQCQSSQTCLWMLVVLNSRVLLSMDGKLIMQTHSQGFILLSCQVVEEALGTILNTDGRR